jgi:hypothetical protein
MNSFKKTYLVCALLIAGFFAMAPQSRADAVTDWNEIAVAAATTGRPGPAGIVDIALVQVAVHDAVQAIEGRYEPYFAEVADARGKRSAAVAAAAYRVLAGTYPAQAGPLEATYVQYLAAHGLTGDPGIGVGEQVAVAVLPLRRADPNPLPPPFTGATEPGRWRPTESYLGSPPAPPSLSPMAAPWMGAFDPFTLTSPMRFRAAPPPALDSARYTRDFNEVKAMGSLDSSARSAEQTDIAYFYSENFLAQWNRALRAIATQKLRRTGDSARLFALANMAGADAIITSWDSKVHYAFWRPLTAIREAAADDNPDTVPDPAWQPLINNPNYPDYTSGANNITGAMMRALALYFGTDRVTFEVTSNAPLAVKKTRVYRRFSGAADDVVNARIWLGIHFRFADLAARIQGQRVAEWVVGHFLLPVDRGSHRDRDAWDDLDD